MKYINKLPEPEILAKQYAINDNSKEKRLLRLNEIRHVLDGTDHRKLVIIGPCSADREDAILDYTMRLKEIESKLPELILIPRIYTGKPRTNGKGYKGLLHRPESDSSEDDLLHGLEHMRQIHQKVITETQLFPADELLYPETYPYVKDLLVYMAIGARSVEDQQHRLIASGMDLPVGMKNPTSGSGTVLLNSIVAAQSSQRLIFSGWDVETQGNAYAHAILRGYVDDQNRNRPNYHYEDIRNVYDEYYRLNLKNPAVIIDCNHSNSDKQYDEQIRIAEEVMFSCSKNKAINRFVKGFMIESYIEDGNQMIGEGVYGKSITDPCLGWKKTEQLLYELNDLNKTVNETKRDKK